MMHGLGRGLLRWRDLYSGSLPHGLDPGLLLLWALGTEEVGADTSVLRLRGEAVRGTGPGLIHPAHSHLLGEDTNSHRVGSQSGRSLHLWLFSPQELRSKERGSPQLSQVLQLVSRYLPRLALWMPLGGSI